MGTRNLTVVVKDGKFVVAQYGQWDGYPSGQGVTALRFLRDHFDRSKFEAALALAKPLDDEGAAKINAIENWKQDYPQMSRDMGAKVLAFIQEQTEPFYLKDDHEFAADGLLCEWVWLVDLDAGMFEGYKGFGKTPLAASERFAFLNDTAAGKNPDCKPIGIGYAPVSFVAAFPLEDLPDEKTFVTHFDILGALNDASDDGEFEVSQEGDAHAMALSSLDLKTNTATYAEVGKGLRFSEDGAEKMAQALTERGMPHVYSEIA